MLRKQQYRYAFALAFGMHAAAMAAEEHGFIEDSTATLGLRNYYFMRDFRNVPNSSQYKAEEWAQGFRLDFKSGFTQGPVGLGLDALGTWGLKLDSGRGRTNTGLLPVHDDGKAAGQYVRVALTAKARYSKTELRYGELLPNLPILAYTDNRLFPQTFQGFMVNSNEIEGLNLQIGRLSSAKKSDSSGDEKMTAWLKDDPVNPNRLVGKGGGDHYNFIGGSYTFNNKLTTVSFWQGQLEDIYQQRFYGIKHRMPLGAVELGAELGYYTTADDGDSDGGSLDNKLLYTLFHAKYKAHTFYLGYEDIHGKDGFVQIRGTLTPIANDVQTYTFSAPDERSWQVRHDYDFATLGVPGLTTTVRYVRGWNVDAVGFRGNEWQRDMNIRYTFQSGPLKGLVVLWRNATARSEYARDIDENRFVLNYSIKLF